MDTKLTLKLNKTIIEKAKEYAAHNQKSLSRLIELYLTTLVETDKNTDIPISPFVKSISNGIKLPNNVDEKKEYREYLSKKYQ
jgi:hypothetical protein